MKFIYPAVFKKVEEHYEGYFPDLEECYGRGETLEDALDHARDAATSWIEVELEEENPKLPPVSDEDDLKLEDGEVIRNILVNIRFMEGWDE